MARRVGEDKMADTSVFIPEPKSVSHPANQATRLLSLRFKRTIEVPFIFYIQSGIESAWLGAASGVCFAA